MTRVEIRNNATGEVRDCSEDLAKLNENQVYTLFVWSTGGSCDCSRAMYFGRPESELLRPCAHGKFSVRLTSANGQRMYSDFAEDL